ncbi:hypothetical protein LTR36_005438 [Oleoguttula mirabilis]|uniref:Phosphatidic acid phosphatase type 2/haloperoxidase domain-containing protein n=1 Tax=Oleoguttula mirabilis TaxID=1507867 RepID=A0AAV9JE41_9PEZI|nr:hypothetical protein LTR36_005438 [Oleoguttula mirabilis]
MSTTTKVKQRYAAHLSRTPSPNKGPDAGLRGLGHYERRLPQWRFKLRQRLIPVVRGETPYLAWTQDTCRSPLLDTYFALTANLGTHTFFMTALPVCFWCGYPDVGVALVQMLAMGVYLSGYAKDLVCLPRPLSPPLQRITMSGSAALEYGFPSTHTTNAVSVALFCLYQLSLSRDNYTDMTYNLLRLGCYCYATSITLGRMYCGMHGFFDVIFGGLLGALIAWLRITYGDAFDGWILTGDWLRPAVVVAALLVAVRINPEPADNCPCFDDSVAFVGVVMGVEVGVWHYARRLAISGGPLADKYPFTNSDLLISAARIIGGIVVVFLWRAAMKPLLLRYLPPIFRFVDVWGVRLPRRYFVQSRDYKIVPTLREDDKVIPPASQISAMFSNLGNPRRRAVSIGPQSEADAREYIANREHRRRNSRSDASPRLKPSKPTIAGLPSPAVDEDAVEVSAALKLPEVQSYMDAGQARKKPSRPFLQVNTVEPFLLTPPPSDGGTSSDSGKEDEKNDREMFSALEKPRIRYDVEVITKLVVYAGIAWLAVEGNPRLFEYLGLV